MRTQASKAFERGVRAIEGLEVVGEPAMSVVAFKAAKGSSLDIYKVNDLMGRRGWHLSPLQFPPALHMCFTAQHVDVVEQLLEVGVGCVCVGGLCKAVGVVSVGEGGGGAWECLHVCVYV